MNFGLIFYFIIVHDLSCSIKMKQFSQDIVRQCLCEVLPNRTLMFDKYNDTLFLSSQ